ncbi:MAG: hypothetical protein HZB25_12420 [Candidatus Eisenbacteria bacterium]|nr:hypothetical protein [Candidatus Eisenbacteria bacterium]
MKSVLLAVGASTPAPLGDRLGWLGTGVRDAATNVGLALVVLAVGWLLARVCLALVQWLLRKLRFNHVVRRILGQSSLAGSLEASTTAGWIVFWGIMLLAMMVSLDLVGIHVRDAVGQRLAEVLPRIVVASFVALGGVLAAVLVGVVIRSALRGMGWMRPAVGAQLGSAAVLVFAGLLALEQLGLAAQLVVGVGLILVAAVGLAAGLAFGLGCRDLARDLLIEYLRSLDGQGGSARSRTGTESE